METTFHERLKYAIQISGLSEQEVCKQTGISPRELERYLTDKFPKARALTKLAITLHVRADYLLGI